MSLLLPLASRRGGLKSATFRLADAPPACESLQRSGQKPARNPTPRVRLLTRLILGAIVALSLGEGLAGCGALPANPSAKSTLVGRSGGANADATFSSSRPLAAEARAAGDANAVAPGAPITGYLAPLGFSPDSSAEASIALPAPLGFWTREGAQLTGEALFAMPELFDSCPTSPAAALAMARDQREKHAMDAVLWPGASATPVVLPAAQSADAAGQSANAQGPLSDQDALRRASFTASLASPIPLATQAAAPASAHASLSAKPFQFTPIDAEADGTQAAENAGRPGGVAKRKKASMFDDPNLRGATFWQDDGVIPGVRPQLEQAGASLFQPFDTAWPAPSAYSASEAGRVAAIKNAMRAHAQKKPAGWERLVAQVREARERDGELAALQLTQALLNEVRYVDGTDGTFYSPAKFFAQSGVCKDYVVAKYILLRESGYPAEKLRIVALAPRFKGEGQAEWHIIVAARAEGQAEPLSLSSPPNPDGAGGAPADVRRGPSALLSQILGGSKPASTVLKHPQGPKVLPLASSDQKGRPVAESFTETGFVSFELSPSALRASGRGALGMGSQPSGDAHYAANARWAELPAGAYPKWALRGVGTDSAFASNDPAAPTKRGKKKRASNDELG